MRVYTLGEWLMVWLEHYIYPSGLAQSTKDCYNRAVQAVPQILSDVALADLSPLDCLLWVQDVARVYPRAAQLDRVMLARALLVARKLHLTGCCAAVACGAGKRSALAALICLWMAF